MILSKAERTAAITRSLASGKRAPLASFDSRQYIQHNVLIGDGLAPILEFMDGLSPADTRADVVRLFEDGDFSVVHADYQLGDWGPMIGFEVHRWENDRIVEHWDNLCVTPGRPNESGRTMTDGETLLTELDKTESNRDLVRRFVDGVLLGGQLETLELFFHNGALVQHSPMYGDGVEAFRNVLAGRNAQQAQRYARVHKILGQGNFFLVISEGELNSRPAALYDLFRVSQGAIAEHWEIHEIIPPRSEWMNVNGKF